MNNLEKLRGLIDEENYPYFTDAYLQSRMDEIGTRKGITLESIAKELCLIKAGIEEMKLGDITIPSPRNHFLRLASSFRKSYTGTVVRADGK
ncbi:hypothetical protein NE686_00540 [Tissierella carlieri]|uniref:Uncharacterized protein n=1 Tax=Tissierella carlieri TaxID=689904 RepID=A0ABT1S512_9FIRM|nr:hypothetical protein [Tissierella carlieri]MCQ4921556.1 hypothetical protein [Tissierella carlieri]